MNEAHGDLHIIHSGILAKITNSYGLCPFYVALYAER
jgi:hypothetical protein